MTSNLDQRLKSKTLLQKEGTLAKVAISRRGLDVTAFHKPSTSKRTDSPKVFLLWNVGGFVRLSIEKGPQIELNSPPASTIGSDQKDF